MKTDFVVGKTASESLYPLGANVSTAINKTPILRNANISLRKDGRPLQVVFKGNQTKLLALSTSATRFLLQIVGEVAGNHMHGLNVEIMEWKCLIQCHA